MRDSLFENDLRLEHELAKYLDANLYISPLFSECIRTTENSAQKSGCDIILSSEEYGLHSAIVDEKATIHYINQDISTFAFELLCKSKNSSKRVPGWLIDDRKKTEAYVLIWPFVKQKDIRGRFDEMTCEDISGVRYLIVKRWKILAYLANRGFTKQVLLDTATAIAQRDIDGRFEIENDKDDYHFYFFSSLTLAEQPVNIVIDRYILWCLADKKGGIIGNPFESRIRGW